MKLVYRVHLSEEEHQSFIKWLRIPEIHHTINFAFGFNLHVTIHRTRGCVQLILHGNSDEAMSDWIETIFMEQKQIEAFIRQLCKKRPFKMPGFAFGFKDHFDGEKVLDLVIETSYLD